MSVQPLEKLEGTWSHLKKHNARQSVFLVLNISLQEVAMAVAEDRKEWIAELVQSEQLRRPKPEEVQKWESDPTWSGYLFSFIIVQPFVFVEYPIEDR